jgi:hypothetical protein
VKLDRLKQITIGAVDEFLTKFLFRKKFKRMVAALRNSRKKINSEKIKKKQVKQVAKESLKRRTRSSSKPIKLRTEEDADRVDENNQSIVEFEEPESENGDEIKLDKNGDKSKSVIRKDTETEQVLQKPEVFDERPPFQENSTKTCSHCGVTDFTSWRNGPSDFPCLCISCNLNWKRGKILLAYKADSPTPNLHTVFLQESEPAVVPESFFASFSSPNETQTPHTPAY